MISRILSALAVAAAFALPLAATAATVYDEALNGDADNTSPPALALVLGKNDILGSVTVSLSQIVPVDFDGFNLVVGPGKKIVSIFVSTVLRSGGSGTFDSITWQIRTPFASQIAGISASGVSLFADSLPRGPGSYNLNSFVLTGEIGTGDYRTTDYTLSVNVAAVPLPGALGLLAGGLGLLALASRRRRG